MAGRYKGEKRVGLGPSYGPGDGSAGSPPETRYLECGTGDAMKDGYTRIGRRSSRQARPGDIVDESRAAENERMMRDYPGPTYSPDY